MHKGSLLVLLLCATGLPGYAQGPQPTPSQMAQLLPRACNGDCVSQFRACGSRPAASGPGLCNTTYVLCSISCQDCAGGFGKCAADAETSPGADSSRCTEEFRACRRKFTAATLDSRPLITFEGGDGRSSEAAVVIKGAQNTREGIRAESLWVGINHPDWQKDHQSLVNRPDGKSFDLIDYVTPQGERRRIYFDITDFFGKR